MEYTKKEQVKDILESYEVDLDYYDIEQIANEIESIYEKDAQQCTHCYGTGKDHGDESMQTECPSCK